MQIDKSKAVMVTGATGYVAGWLVKQLLDNGINVHAAVRDPDNKEKVAHLDAIAANASGNIKYFKADLLTEGAYDAAMEGCELVYHTASPFILNFKNPQKELVDPAVNGTRNVLNAVNRTATVKRVVLTSSVAAIHCDNIELQDTKNGMFTEEDWNTASSLKYKPYAYSKVMAEKEAWKMAQAQNRWDLVAVHPSVVMGPAINPNTTSASFDMAKMLGDGTLKAGAPGVNIGGVDVRDVAEIHYQAGFNPAANGRYIANSVETSFMDWAKTLKANFPSHSFPPFKMPKWFMLLIAPMTGMSYKEIIRNMDHPWKADNSKVRQELGIEFRPLEPAMCEMFQQMIDAEQV